MIDFQYFVKNYEYFFKVGMNLYLIYVLVQI